MNVYVFAYVCICPSISNYTSIYLSIDLSIDLYIHLSSCAVRTAAMCSLLKKDSFVSAMHPAMILFVLAFGYPPKKGSGGEDRHKTVSLEHWITR